MIRYRMTGVRELAEALRELPRRTGKNVHRRAMRQALEPVAADAQSRAPRDTGKLASKITVATSLSRRQRREAGEAKDSVRAYVGATPSRVAHLVELGSAPRRHKSGKSTGRMPAQPFLGPAFAAGVQKVLADYAAAIRVEIERAAARLARKRARDAARGEP